MLQFTAPLQRSDLITCQPATRWQTPTRSSVCETQTHLKDLPPHVWSPNDDVCDPLCCWSSSHTTYLLSALCRTNVLPHLSLHLNNNKAKWIECWSPETTKKGNWCCYNIHNIVKHPTGGFIKELIHLKKAVCTERKHNLHYLCLSLWWRLFIYVYPSVEQSLYKHLVTDVLVCSKEEAASIMLTSRLACKYITPTEPHSKPGSCGLSGVKCRKLFELWCSWGWIEVFTPKTK